MHLKSLALLPALALALMLSACSQAAGPPPTSAPAATSAAANPTNPPAPTAAAPTVAPTAAPAPTAAAPTVAPTAAPAPTSVAAGVLPAPLLFINGENELARMDVDGKTVTTLTTEQGLIIEFAVAPSSGAIAYLTIAADGPTTTLLRANADGSGRTELARGIIRGVTAVADGSVQAGVVGDTTGADGAALQPGTWSFPADGSAPALLVAATEPTKAADGNTTPGAYYQPLAWSPDASKLLIRLTMNMGPDGPGGDIGSTGLALYDSADKQARELLPLGKEPLCVAATWARASDAIFCANGAQIGGPTPALWRLDLADGGQKTIIPAAEPLVATFSPREMPEGLYVLVGTYGDSGLKLMPQRISPGADPIDQLPLPIETGLDGGLWATNASGMVFGRPTASANRVIVWQPLGDGAAVELINGSIGQLEWAVQ